jgi:hypothetical protein
VHNTQLLAATIQKQQVYQPLVEDLGYYTEQGWVVHWHVFPRVVGIRGMIDTSHVESLLKFLDIQRKYWRVTAERVALASVRAFHFLHRVRFGGPFEPVRPDLESELSDNSSGTSDDDASVVASKREYRQTSTSPAPEDSDSEIVGIAGGGQFP